MSELDQLYADLSALREAEDPTAPVHAQRWTHISAWIDRNLGGDSDRRQETLIALFRNVGAMKATAPKQAAKWVSTIHRRKRIDAARAAQSDPVAVGLRAVSADDGVDPLERIEGSAPVDASEDLLGQLEERTMHYVERYLAASVASAKKRALRRLQARAAFERGVLERTSEEIRAALGELAPQKNDALYKWVERGRPVLTKSLELWLGEASDQEAAVLRGLRQRLAP